MRLILALLLLASPATAADVSSRTSLNLMGGGSMGHGFFDATLSERLRVRWSTEQVRGQLHFDGRVGVRAPDGSMHRTRIRALGVRLDFERAWIDLGRFRVAGGAWRLADGVQGLVRLGGGVELGGWFGEVPDPFTTLPAPRIGGGPLFRWLHDKAQLSVGAEVAGTTAGLDRAALMLRGRVEPIEQIDVAAHLDLQDVAGVPQPADAGVIATFDLIDVLRIRAFWNTWSGLAFNQGHARDVALSRFAQRFGDTLPNDATDIDLSLYHQGGGSVRLRPGIGEVARFVLVIEGRGRGHQDASRHFARGTVRVGFERIGGRLDIGTDHSAVYWNEGWRWDGGLAVRVEAVKDRFAIDGSFRVALGAADPALYADLFLDIDLGPVTLSAGYRFTDELNRDQWAAAHVGLFRASWTFKKRGKR